jgi:competence protein ComEC
VDDELLDAVQPALSVISVGADNRFGHPADSTLQTLNGRNVPVMRTDEFGDITVTVRRTGLEVAVQKLPGL